VISVALDKTFNDLFSAPQFFFSAQSPTATEMSLFDEMIYFEHAKYTFSRSAFEAAYLTYELKHANPRGLTLVDSLGRIVSHSNIRLTPQFDTQLFTSLFSIFKDEALWVLIKNYIVGDPINIPLLIEWDKPLFSEFLSRLYFRHLRSLQLRKKKDPSWELKTLEIHTIQKQTNKDDVSALFQATVLVAPMSLSLNGQKVTIEEVQQQYTRGSGLWNWLFPKLCLTVKFHCTTFGDDANMGTMSFQ
jgi:hypothetical protein